MKRVIRNCSEADDNIEASYKHTRSPYSFAVDVQQGLQGMFNTIGRKGVAQYFDDDALVDALDTLNRNMTKFKSKYDKGF